MLSFLVIWAVLIVLIVAFVHGGTKVNSDYLDDDEANVENADVKEHASIRENVECNN